MTLARERWQERMRYAMDTGSVPPTPRRVRWRWVLACLGIVLACAVYLGVSDRSRVEPDLEPKPTALALAGAEPTRKRSYTRTASSDLTAAAQPAVAQSETAAPRAQVALADPPTTGTVSPVLRDETQPAQATSPDKPAKRSTLRPVRRTAEQRASETRQVRTSPSDARDRVKRATEQAAPPSSARPQHRQQPVVANARPERAAAAPARVVSVCLYFVICF